MRRSARVAERAAGGGALPLPLPLPLPAALAHAIFSLLSHDDRGRAACVSRAWRNAMADAMLWTRLVITERGGGDSVLLGAAAKAPAGTLTTLNVCDDTVSTDAFKAVFLSHATSLREACLLASNYTPEFADWRFQQDELAELFGAAPALRVFLTDVFCAAPQVVAELFRSEAYAPLRVRQLTTSCDDDDEVTEVVACCAAHPSLSGLSLRDSDLTEAGTFDTVVNLAVSKPLAALHLREGVVPRNFLPSLLRLLGPDTALRSLEISNVYLDEDDDVDADVEVLNTVSATQLATALATCPLEHLAFMDSNVWEHATVGVPLLHALTAHPSLTGLSLANNHRTAHNPEVAAALSALLVANAPALRILDVAFTGLDPQTLAPMFDALCRNTHVRELDLRGIDFSPAYVQAVVLPGVRANSSLRAVYLHKEYVQNRQIMNEDVPEHLQAAQMLLDKLMRRNAARARA